MNLVADQLMALNKVSPIEKHRIPMQQFLSKELYSLIKRRSNQFNRQFTLLPTTVSKTKTQLRRHLQKQSYLRMLSTEEEFNLTICSTKNSKAFGPDNKYYKCSQTHESNDINA